MIKSLRRTFTGVPTYAWAACACAESAEHKVIVLIASNLGAAETFAEETASLLATLKGAKPEIKILTEPDAAIPTFEADCDLLGVLSALRHGQHTAQNPLIIACTPPTLLRASPSHQKIKQREWVIRKGDRLSIKECAQKLATEFGYDHEVLCEQPGEFALRGGIIDVYPLNATMPVRLDLFGEMVESLRPFDPATQRSEGEMEGLVICAPKEDLSQEDLDPFYRHLPPESLLIGVNEVFEQPILQELQGSNLNILSLQDTDDPPFDWEVKPLLSQSADTLRIGNDNDSLSHRLGLMQEAARQCRDGKLCLLAGDTEGSVERLRQEIKELSLTHFSPQIIQARFSGGFILPAQNFSGPLAQGIILLTERELFGRKNRPLATLPRRRTAQQPAIGRALDFGEISEGDFLVHATQGICLYRGIRPFENNGRTEDYVSLEFANKATLHLPLRESHLLSRYVGIGRGLPKLSKLGGGGWERSRKQVEKATIDLATQLLRLQAERATKPGLVHLADQENPWMGEFERSFPYRETPDQAKAIRECKADMEQPIPMDRLICGDVGFGKTEVALRAAFKSVLSGYQVAILAPTTVLAQQHFATFRERLRRWPVSIELLSSFRSTKQKSQVRAKAAAGLVDIVVGTHALLSDGTSFAKLGLVIIDEEHRFGVRHKERLKRLRTEVDVLAMSATPIPRTLYLALLGARNLSVIETPPRERLPIRTVVRHYDEKLVSDAIKAELNRGGQVFYLHNRVETIQAVAEKLRTLIPQAKIVVGHGQMSAGELEDTMAAFVAGEFDVLVCTTIIETGLDIPNCNPLIIEGADRFGLAQLYQLRGRVGRFNRQAYAYLFLHHHTAILESARQRLSAIRQYNQLGAGFRIAMRDLELRGAGNILGAEQSGHISTVGFELYCQLLRRSVAKAKGEKQALVERCEVNLDFVSFGSLSDSLTHSEDEKSSTQLTATLPSNWIPETRLRIEAFRKIALTTDAQEIADLKLSLTDRYGKLPPEAEALLELGEIRCLGEAKGVLTISSQENVLRCEQCNNQGRFEPVLVGNRFPRLTARDPLRKLKEIRQFLLRLPHPFSQ